MKIQNQEAKEKLVQRLRRIEGQVRGVQAMLEEERDCQEILQQLSSVRSAVQSASRFFLQEYATACLVEMDQDAKMDLDAKIDQEANTDYNSRTKREKIIHDMIELLDKAP